MKGIKLKALPANLKWALKDAVLFVACGIIRKWITAGPVTVRQLQFRRLGDYVSRPGNDDKLIILKSEFGSGLGDTVRRLAVRSHVSLLGIGGDDKIICHLRQVLVRFCPQYADE